MSLSQSLSWSRGLSDLELLLEAELGMERKKSGAREGSI